MMSLWERMDGILDRVEYALLIILLGLMILIAFLQIVLRNVFATGLAWGDPLVRNLVLWVGFIGAALATREGKHINIDVLSRWMPGRGKTVSDILTRLFSFFVCGLLCFAALKFVRNEALMGQTTFLGIPGWIPQIILPITFGVMAFRFGLQALKKLSQIMKRDSIPNQEGEK